MNRRHLANPSFSSSLLDEIYRSIDGVEDRNKKDEKEFSVHNKKRTSVKVEEWMMEKKKIREKVNYVNWSSSESSDFSSGEFSGQKPKPVRTGLQPVRTEKKSECCEKEKSFGKTKSRAMKIYGDLKKVKQPISPGGRLATFLNSIFTTGTPKKAKISSTTREQFNVTIPQNNPKPKSSNTSTCSSASSFSRSCLSNSSSREKPINGEKRSVRFLPVSVVLGQDEKIPQYKAEMRNTINEEIKLRIMEKNRRVEEAARKLLKDYQKVEFEYFNVKDIRKQNVQKLRDYEDVDDDAASYASSDLFELDHLSSIEDLPVYETTQIRKNLAIANGLIP